MIKRSIDREDSLLPSLEEKRDEEGSSFVGKFSNSVFYSVYFFFSFLPSSDIVNSGY